MIDGEKLKQEFLSKARSHIKRDGIEDVLNVLEKSDFFSAPASTRFHGSYKHGLVEHSLNVFNRLMECDESDLDDIPTESLAIVSLFHDICKVGFYTVEYRNSKNEKGQWVKVPYYTVDDLVPFGHGEKSVILLMEHMTLTFDEILAIRWHMGLGVPKDDYMGLSSAFTKSKLPLYLNFADMCATYIDEKI